MFGLLGILRALLLSSSTMLEMRRIRCVALTVVLFVVAAFVWNCLPEKVVVVSVAAAAVVVKEEVVHPEARVVAVGSTLMIVATSAEVVDTMLEIVPSPAGAKVARDRAAVVLGLVRASYVLVLRVTAAVAAENGIATVSVIVIAVPVPRLRRKLPDQSVR